MSASEDTETMVAATLTKIYFDMNCGAIATTAEIVAQYRRTLQALREPETSGQKGSIEFSPSPFD